MDTINHALSERTRLAIEEKVRRERERLSSDYETIISEWKRAKRAASEAQARVKATSILGRHKAKRVLKPDYIPSRFRGVTVLPPRRLGNRARVSYIARIRIEGRSKVIGNFRTDIEAAQAYDAAAKLQFGDRAILNFPYYLKEIPQLSTTQYPSDEEII